MTRIDPSGPTAISGLDALVLSTLHLAASLLLLVTVAAPASAQVEAQTQGIGTPSDWSHNHLIFSGPGTFQILAIYGAPTSEIVATIIAITVEQSRPVLSSVFICC